MNYMQEDTPLLYSSETASRMAAWSAAVARGEKASAAVYPKPSDAQLRELEHELENAVRVVDEENQAMNPTAPILDYSEDHEFVSANQLDNYYAEEDLVDAKEEEKRRLTKGNAPKTEIQKFYKGQSVFLTGGSGFLGKVIIEKLLRSCGDIENIFVLLRSKKGKDTRTRLKEIMDDFVFHRVNAENPKGVFKVVPIVGDMELPGLGISEEDKKMLTAKVTVIINAAATVKFDEKLSAATAINVRGTRGVIGFAKECKNLKALTHISTAFAHSHHKSIEEKFYEPPMSVEALEAVAAIDEGLLEDITPKLLGKYPNTYCFTKAVAEEAVRKFGEGMPICIVRPSIVVSTYEEPVRGWTDSMYGPAGLMIGIGTGVLRTMYIDLEKQADMVPVDLVVNAVLAATWHTAKRFRENQTSDIPIYNFVSGAQNPQTWGSFMDLNQKHGIDKPTTKAVWYYGLTPTSSYGLFLVLNLFLHYLPACAVDAFCALTGRKRVMLQFYNKVIHLAKILFYFTMQEWRFTDHGVRAMWGALDADDRVVFPFNIAEMSWDYHAETFLVGLRVYLVKDDLSTLPEARKKWTRLYYLHQSVKLVTLGLLLNLAYIILRCLVRTVFG
ncbi:fatty acyl-CoA reductase wat-like isoform X2 [Choristoneura fumiferana]|uniref:fatty acyl-CoA reductase wat-like isoform X2 n=1 Tax=Choristoneura fumiferana TaxID=7141 RepID=UPI003D15F112